MLYGLHNDALRLLCEEVHYDGLAMAAKALWRQGRMPRKLFRRMANLDIAFHVVRHVDAALCRDLMAELMSIRGVGKPPQPGGSVSDAASTISAVSECTSSDDVSVIETVVAEMVQFPLLEYAMVDNESQTVGAAPAVACDNATQTEPFFAPPTLLGPFSEVAVAGFTSPDGQVNGAKVFEAAGLADPVPSTGAVASGVEEEFGPCSTASVVVETYQFAQGKVDHCVAPHGSASVGVEVVPSGSATVAVSSVAGPAPSSDASGAIAPVAVSSAAGPAPLSGASGGEDPGSSAARWRLCVAAAGGDPDRSAWLLSLCHAAPS